MPKTTFTDLVTPIAAAFLNKIFTHVHDGLDQDGSAPKVDLGAHTNLDTGGERIKAPGHAIGWIVYAFDGTTTLTLKDAENMQLGAFSIPHRLEFIDDPGVADDDMCIQVTVTQASGEVLIPDPSLDSGDVLVDFWDTSGAYKSSFSNAHLVYVAVFGHEV